MEEGIIGLLLADGPLAALVGTRVWPNQRPQGQSLPAITLVRISGGPIYADDGEVGLINGRIQLDCWGENYPDAKNTARAVTEALSAVRDVVSESITFRYITLDDERDLQEPGANTSEYLHRVSLDFNVWADYG